MRHRLITHSIGLGNAEPAILDNQGNLNPAFAQDAIETYFADFTGFDFKVEKNVVTIGIEPAYQYESLKIISINKDKSKSYIETGVAWGPYGSGIAKTTKKYSDYKNKTKFVKFVDKWHSVLFK